MLSFVSLLQLGCPLLLLVGHWTLLLILLLRSIFFIIQLKLIIILVFLLFPNRVIVHYCIDINVLLDQDLPRLDK